MADMDGTSFQGRILHIMRAKRLKESNEESNVGEVKNSNLSTYQQKRELERKKMAGKKEGWNSSFVRSDTVVGTLAERFDISKADIMDTSTGTVTILQI